MSEEVETIEVVDPIEAAYGNTDKATKRVPKPKAEPKVEAKAEPKVEEKTPEIVVEDKKAEAKKPADKVSDKSPDKQEAKKDEKPIEVADDFNDILDVPKEKKKEVKSEGKDLTKEQLERDQKFEQYKTKAEKFDALGSTPIGKVVLKAIELGNDPIEAIKGLPLGDYSKMSSPDSDEYRAREYFSKIEGESGETLQNSVEEFLAMDENQIKKKMRRDQVSDLSQAQHKMLKERSESMESANSRGNEIVTRLNNDVEGFVKDAKKKGGKLFGMQLTDEQFSELPQEMKDFSLLNEDGFVDVNKLAACVFFIKHGRQRMKDIYIKAESKGKEEVLETVHNVDPNFQTLSNVVAQKKITTATDAIEKAYGGG